MGAAETGRGWFGELDRDGALNGLLLSRSVDDSVAAFTDQGIQAVVAKLHSRLDLWRVVTDRGARIFVVWHISMIDKAIHTELPVVGPIEQRFALVQFRMCLKRVRTGWAEIDVSF